MILKLGMKHQTIELYKVCINHDPWMTLTYLRQGQLGLPLHLNGEIFKIHSQGKTCSKLAYGLNFYDLKKKLTPGLALSWGYIHVYYHSSQTSLFVYISGLR